MDEKSTEQDSPTSECAYEIIEAPTDEEIHGVLTEADEMLPEYNFVDTVAKRNDAKGIGEVYVPTDAELLARENQIVIKKPGYLAVERLRECQSVVDDVQDGVTIKRALERVGKTWTWFSNMRAQYSEIESAFQLAKRLASEVKEQRLESLETNAIDTVENLLESRDEEVALGAAKVALSHVVAKEKNSIDKNKGNEVQQTNIQFNLGAEYGFG
jgi:hypothetical protein